MNARERVRAFLSNDPFSGIPEGAPVLGGIAGGERPSRYSQSPALWNRFFDELGVPGLYTAFDLPRADAMQEFLAAVFSLPGFIDLTVTNPFKHDAYNALASLPLKTVVTGRVRDMKSLNHLTRNPISGEIIADNTDGQGMIRALKKRTTLRGKKAVIGGAGGAALAIGYELLAEDAELCIVNIVPEDGLRLAELLGSCFCNGKVSALPWDMMHKAASSAGIVISAVTAGTPLDEAALRGLSGACLFADARYGEKAEFARAARRAGRLCVDGREMLYGQFRVIAETLRGLAEPSRIVRTLDVIENWFYNSPE